MSSESFSVLLRLIIIILCLGAGTFFLRKKTVLIWKKIPKKGLRKLRLSMKISIVIIATYIPTRCAIYAIDWFQGELSITHSLLPVIFDISLVYFVLSVRINLKRAIKMHESNKNSE